MIRYYSRNWWASEGWIWGGLSTMTAGSLLANAGAGAIVVKSRGINARSRDIFNAACVGTLAGLGGYIVGLFVFLPIYNNTFVIERLLPFGDAYYVSTIWAPTLFATAATASVTTLIMSKRHRNNGYQDALFQQHDPSTQSELNLKPRWNFGAVPAQGGARLTIQAQF
ncbi:MAG: hypothetical protein AAGI01_17440 [Myxococcota bacterium]